MDTDTAGTSRFREMAQIIRLALEVESRRGEVLDWYRHTPVERFAYRTAEQMVRHGEAVAVIAFLQQAVATDAADSSSRAPAGSAWAVSNDPCLRRGE